MATTAKKPRIRRTAQNTQYTYNVPQRVHTVHAYPVLSPQGASILLYGHQDGVCILWRGGRRFRSEKEKEKTVHNGAKPEDAVMIIDSDDEEQQQQSEKERASTTDDSPQFEDTLPEDEDYPDVIQTLDLSLGTAVYQIASVAMKPCAAKDAAWDGAEVLTEKMVFAVGCATGEVHFMTLPLTPPSSRSKARVELLENLLAGKAGNGKWGETMTLLAGQQKPSNALAMTVIKPKSSASTSPSLDKNPSKSSARIVVASHAPDAAGTLRLWDVSLDKAPKGRMVDSFQTEYLPHSLSSLSFNSSHSSQLLCVAPAHAVRIYDYAAPSMPSDDLSDGAFPTQGSWLLSLYAPFLRPSKFCKPILDAAWICHGRAVFALLADGQWGIWDLDSVAPQAGTSLFQPRQRSRAVIANLAAFAISGFVDGTAALRSPVSHRSTGGSGGDYMPMTPHTRRETSLSAFASPGDTGGAERFIGVKGGIDVLPLPAPVATVAPSDETAVLWISGLDDKVMVVAVIPAIHKFWEAQTRGGVNLFGGRDDAKASSRMVTISDLAVGLMGERCTSVAPIAQISFVSSAQGEEDEDDDEDDREDEHSEAGPKKKNIPLDVVVCGETRLVVVRESETAVGTRIGGVMMAYGGSPNPNLKHGNSNSNPEEIMRKRRKNSVIVVHPRPQNPASVEFNLSFRPRRGQSLHSDAKDEMEGQGETEDSVLGPLGGPAAKKPTGEFGRASVAKNAFGGSMFGTSGVGTGEKRKEKQGEQLAEQASVSEGFMYAASMERAASEPQREEDEQRDVEAEMLDLMELDRALDGLNWSRSGGI